MKILRENTVDGALEKHVPVVTRSAEGIVVTVGSVDHPMTPDHFIEWIEIFSDNMNFTVFLKPGDSPKACFHEIMGDITARAYCNLHGVWKEQWTLTILPRQCFRTAWS